MTLPAWFYSPSAQALGWTLVHSLWEMALAALVVAAGFLALRRRSANARYLLGCAGLLLMLALPAATYFYVLPPAAAPHALVSQLDTTLPPPSASLIHGMPAAPPAIQAPLPHQAPRPAPWRTRVRTALEPCLPGAVLIYFAGTVVLLLRLAAGYGKLRHTVRRAYPAAPALQTTLLALTRTMAVSRPVRLLESAAVEVPTLIGALRPVILFPVAALTGLSPDQLAALLAHELAHIRRHDYLVNLAQCAVETLLFHHPAVWWLSARIRQEREHCCDEAAIAATSDRLRYAEALASMEALRVPAGLVMAAAGGSLVARIRHILGVPAPRSPRRFLTLSAAAFFICLLAGMAYVGCNRSTSSSAAAPTTAQSAAPAPHAIPASAPADSATTHTYDLRYLLPPGPAAAREQVIGSIVETIEASVAPDSWKANGGTGDIIVQPDFRLTISNAPQNLAGANRILAKLFDTRALGVVMECRGILVPSKVMDDFRLAWDLKVPVAADKPAESARASIIDNWTLSQLLQAAYDDKHTFDLQTARVAAPNGSSLNAIVGLQQDGPKAAAARAAFPDLAGVRALATLSASADRRYVVLDLVLDKSAAALANMPTDKAALKARIESQGLVPFSEVSIHTEASVPDGGTLIADAGPMTSAAGDNYRLLILVRPNLRAGSIPIDGEKSLFEQAGGMPVKATAAAPAPAAIDANQAAHDKLEATAREFIVDHQPLDTILHTLGDAMGANLVVNWNAVTAAGINKNTIVTTSLRETPYRKVLTTVLTLVSQANGDKAALDYIIDDGVITISTREDLQSAKYQVVRVYDIRDMRLPSSAPNDTNTPHASLDDMPEVDIPFTRKPPAESLDQRDDQRVAPLIDTIKKTVAPDSWKDNGGTGEFHFLNGQLIVTQTAENQKAVFQLLQQLREARSLQVAFQAQLLLVSDDTLKAMGYEKKIVRPVAPPKPGDPAAGSAQLPPPEFLDDKALATLLATAQKAKDTSIITAPRVTLFNGQPGWIGETNQQNIVESATPGTGPDGKPAPHLKIKTLQSGVMVNVQATASADRKSVVIKLNPQIKAIDKIETINLPEVGTGAFKQLPKERSTEFNTVLAIPAGKACVFFEAPWEGNFPVGDQLQSAGWQNSPPLENPGTRNLLVIVRPEIIEHKEIENDLFGPGHDKATGLP